MKPSSIVRYLLICMFIILILDFVSSAHFIVGKVNNSLSGESANGHTIIFWNEVYGSQFNITDTIGPLGNSYTDNFYMVDCEMLENPCAIGDVLQFRVLDNGDGYYSSNKSIVITGAGYDLADEIVINSKPLIISLILDDQTIDNQIDLIPNSTKTVYCEGIISDSDGENDLKNVTSKLFHSTDSSYSQPDDNNEHYTNNSCSIDASYGNAQESYFRCGYNMQYYSNYGFWNCTIFSLDSINASHINSNKSLINPLLAIELPDFLDFGTVGAGESSPEKIINITNFGNVAINLSLSGYAKYPGDSLSMNCSTNSNISIEHTKYNLTDSNLGDMEFNSLNVFYKNLSSNAITREFNLYSRQEDSQAYLDDTSNTYWRTYVPLNSGGTCTGNIVIGAVQAPSE